MKSQRKVVELPINQDFSLKMVKHDSRSSDNKKTQNLTIEEVKIDKDVQSNNGNLFKPSSKRKVKITPLSLG